MNDEPLQRVVYWDASAILSALFRDRHSAQALNWSRRASAHLMTSLAWAEVQAVAARMVRQAAITAEVADSARKRLAAGPWRRLYAVPAWDVAQRLAARWPLRGADLWHLATAETLRAELPEIALLTFDERLYEAADGEGLAADRTET